MRSGLRFLFLQGPHGPFFGQLAAQVLATGASVMRIGLNKGDEVSWPKHLAYIGHTGPLADWPEALRGHLSANEITDIVLYGDGRPVHAAARRLAQNLGLRLHCFEEGYLRPYWVTYERGGTNGNSPLMDMSLAHIRQAVSGQTHELRASPPLWGSIWHHSWHGALYHGQILFRNRHYPNFEPHRDAGIAAEWWLQTLRLVALPVARWRRNRATRWLLGNGVPYHLVLLQLGHDSSVADHSDFASMRAFMQTCIAAFAEGAPANELLVFKAHPLEDGREALRQACITIAGQHGVAQRVHYVDGGHLGPLLDSAKCVVTINSTAGQQALWRGLPLKALGRAVYGKPQFVSQQPLVDFFRNPLGPDAAAYREYRAFLLATSQVAGNFYMAKGRARILRGVVPMMLAEADPYQEFGRQKQAGSARLRLVGNNETS